MIHPFHFLLFAALQTCQIDLGEHILIVEVADTAASQSKGLMDRDHLEEGKGMLFVFKTPSILSFWMKNTKIPLSIGFFDETKQLIETFDMTPPPLNAKRLPSFQSSKEASYALEVPQSWFQTHNIRPGMKFSFHDPSNAIE